MPADSTPVNEEETTLGNLFNLQSSDGIDVTAVLCNHAEVSNGLIYMLGGGINRITIPTNTPQPWFANLALGVILDIPWTETNKDHKVSISLVDDDSQTIFLPTPEGSVAPFHAEAAFNVGRPPMLPVGTVQNVTLAFNFPGLPLPRLGLYIFSIEVDGIERKKLISTVAVQQ